MAINVTEQRNVQMLATIAYYESIAQQGLIVIATSPQGRLIATTINTATRALERQRLQARLL